MDIVDVVRILPVLSEDLFGIEIFRHVYCTLGVFHELAVAIFIVAISVAVCVQVNNLRIEQISRSLTVNRSKRIHLLIVEYKLFQ